MINFNQFLKQAQEMQQKCKDSQNEVINKEFLGKSGGLMVQMTINGLGEAKKITIDPALLQLSEKKILEDLIIAAFNDAKSKLDHESRDLMSNAFTNIPLSPNFKMPF
jgi:DNA-binding YbaB/EbfC family protein